MSSLGASNTIAQTGRNPGNVGYGNLAWGWPQIDGETLSLPTGDSTLFGINLSSSLNGRLSAGIAGIVVLGFMLFFVFTRRVQL